MNGIEKLKQLTYVYRVALNEGIASVGGRTGRRTFRRLVEVGKCV